MCGITGIVDLRDRRPVDRDQLARMNDTQAHRGPDDVGYHVEPGVGLAFRRLSIIDLNTGHQPIYNEDGSVAVIFNGEIYNYQSLVAELTSLGHHFRTRSDTEAIVHAWEQWGEDCVLRFRGMFAFALWDRTRETLFLARDRLGVKPLYYAPLADGRLVFGSELKSLMAHHGWSRDLEPCAVEDYFALGYVPEPRTIFTGALKLPPGHTLTLMRNAPVPAPREYWDVRFTLDNPIETDDALAELTARLKESVKLRLIADVPLGAFLSGGVDSSSVVSVMQKISSRPVKTFTIGFNEAAYNEAEDAKVVARHLGTDHTELYVTPEQAMAVIPRLPTMYDEPFADSSQIPTHLVSALARQHVTVSLSGDGGDELFGGYDRYLLTMGFWDKIAGVPLPLRAAAARALTLMPAAAWTRLGDAAGGMLPRSVRLGRLGDKVHKGAPMLKSQSLDALYDRMLSQWRDPRTVVVGATDSAAATPTGEDLAGLGGVERMMAQDMLGYLPNDILAKVDRAAMAVSLETRVPLLDPEVVEFAWRLPLGLKIRGSTTKWILRQVLYRHVPQALIERPKMGFGIPLDSWLRGPLRDWAEALIDERRLTDEGYFQAGAIRQAWSALIGGDSRQQFKIWSALMFQSWLDAQGLRTSNPEPRVAAVAG